MRLFSLFAVFLALAPATIPAALPSAEGILETTAVRGGLVVHVGCGDGELTVALRADKRYVVHGLDADPAEIEKAKALIHAKGIYGPVSVARFDGEHLPYAGDLVNLVVVSSPDCRVSREEIGRVLAPGGVAITADGKQTRKPWPDDIDEWSHFLHDASNDCTARDKRVGPPRQMIWHCGPLWTRSHEHASSLVAMVTAGGRVYYIFDEGLTSVTDAPVPERWTLIARDAFNGMLLWKRRMDNWRAGMWTNRSLRSVPPSVQRLLVAEGDRLFTPIGLAAPVSIMDGATGALLATCEGSDGAQELRCVENMLLVRKNSDGIIAYNATTGKRLWQAAGNILPNSMAAHGGKAFYQVGANVTCLDLTTGGELWRAGETAAETKKAKKAKRPAASPIIVHGDTVLFNGARGLTAVSAEGGKILWEGKGRMGGQTFVAGGKLWQHQGQQMTSIDLETGSSSDAVDASDVFTPGHHPRCYQAKATTEYAITPNRGMEFVSLTGRSNSQHDWARGSCTYGIMPANGLLYAPPHPCFCYPGVKLTGFNTLASGSTSAPVPDGRLEKGSAYGKTADARSQVSGPGDWPTYRHDARRTGATVCDTPAEAAPLWSAKLSAPLTPPVASGGRIYVAEKNAHTLHALKLHDGATAWRFTTGGRIDSPPTLYDGLVLLGCTDGYVYALRASDGALVWRFRAARGERLIVNESQLESAWPVHGSVLLHDGLAYCTAGRSTYLDGGITVLALEPATGKLRHERTLDTWSRTRDDAVDKPFVAGYHMEGSHSDILVSEGGHIYMGQYKFDASLNEQPTPYILPGSDDPKVAPMNLTDKAFVDQSIPKTESLEVHQRKWLEHAAKDLVAKLREKHGAFNLGHRRMGRHVFSTSGFLDDSWFNRTYWMYAESWPGFYIAHVAAKTGQLLVVGPDRTYAVQAYPRRNMQSPLFTPGDKGYLLIADANDNEPVLQDRTRETTKGWGFTRGAPPTWHEWVPIRIRAMVLAGDKLFVAGAPDVVDKENPMAAFDGEKGAVLRTVAAGNGKILAECRLEAPPVFDGLIAAAGRLLVCTTDGKIVCLGQ